MNYIIRFSTFPGNKRLSKVVYIRDFKFYCPFNKTSMMSTTGSEKQAKRYPNKIAKKILNNLVKNFPDAIMIEK